MLPPTKEGVSGGRGTQPLPHVLHLLPVLDQPGAQGPRVKEPSDAPGQARAQRWGTAEGQMVMSYMSPSAPMHVSL